MEIINQLNQINNEEELFEQLLHQVLGEDDGDPIRTASLIRAGRDIRFDLEKLNKDNGNNS